MSLSNTTSPHTGPPSPAETHNLIASVAHALWAERKRRQEPDDPEADWFRAEQLIEDLRSHRPLSADEPEVS